MTLIKKPAPALPAPVAASSAGMTDNVAALLERLRAAEAAVAAEKARADAAEAARQTAARGYSAKASEKGAVSIYGVSSRFPVTLYAPHFVGVALDFIMTEKGVAFLRENADRLSVKVGGVGAAGTPASRAEVLRLADRLAAAVDRLK